MPDIDISGLDKLDVLAALYNRAKPQGMGFLHYTPEPMTREEAQFEWDQVHAQKWRQGHFDYVKGHVMKVRLDGDSFDPRGYDRDNGQGAAAAVIAKLRLSTEATHAD